MRFPSLALRVCVPVLLAVVAGCASVPPSAPAPTAPPQPKPYVEPPPPPVNLQGFPPTYRLGFGDGCASGRGDEKKDSARYAADGNYRTGWHDGLAQCGKR